MKSTGLFFLFFFSRDRHAAGGSHKNEMNVILIFFEPLFKLGLFNYAQLFRESMPDA